MPQKAKNEEAPKPTFDGQFFTVAVQSEELLNAYYRGERDVFSDTWPPSPEAAD